MKEKSNMFFGLFDGMSQYDRGYKNGVADEMKRRTITLSELESKIAFAIMKMINEEVVSLRNDEIDSKVSNIEAILSLNNLYDAIDRGQYWKYAK